MKANHRYISASELGDFTFCPRGWWLRKKGKLPETRAMKSGTAQHIKLETTVFLPNLLNSIGVLLVIVSLIIAIFLLA